MKEKIKLFIITCITISTPIFFTGSAFDDEGESPIKHKKILAYNKTSQQKLDDILNDPAFIKLQKLHAEFKKEKEDLGNRSKKTNMTNEDFQKEFKKIRNNFDTKQAEFKSHHKGHKLYSLLESQELIEEFRKLQNDQEEPLKKLYLFTKETYNRKKYEEERLKIERFHEAIRTFVRLFSEEPKTAIEKEVMTELQDAANAYKTSWNSIKNDLLAKPTYENETYFQEAQKILAEEYNAKIQKIRNRLRHDIEELQLAERLAATAQATNENPQSLLTKPEAKNTQGQEQVYAAAKLAKSIGGGLRSHL